LDKGNEKGAVCVTVIWNSPTGKKRIWPISILLPCLLPVGGHQEAWRGEERTSSGHPPPTMTPPMLCLLPARENAASQNNQDGREEQNDAKICGPFSVGQVRLP